MMPMFNAKNVRLQKESARCFSNLSTETHIIPNEPMAQPVNEYFQYIVPCPPSLRIRRTNAGAIAMNVPKMTVYFGRDRRTGKN